jgi:hypothetical protein
VSGRAYGGATRTTDGGADERVKARDGSEKRAASGADRAIRQSGIAAARRASAERDACCDAKNECYRLQHDLLQEAFRESLNPGCAEKFRSVP